MCGRFGQAYAWEDAHAFGGPLTDPRSVGVHGNLYDCATGIEAGMRYLRLAPA